MKRILRVLVSLIVVFSFAELSAQPGCPDVDAGPDVIVPCGQTCANLNATAFAAAATTSYSVGQIPYAPPFGFSNGTNILVQIDDTWGNVINLPFNFCYFGIVYNQVVVGSNGVISFNVNNANGFNSWNIPGPIPFNMPADLINCIMGPWQDIDPTNQGGVYYDIQGTYPCRSFEVSWFQTPYYGDPNSVSTGSCNNPLFATQQIVLYEVTNVIEMYIQNKEVCSGWNGGLAIQGLQGPSGQTAVVPGRNATQWTASNDAWRFTPNGAPNYTIAWYDSTALIANTNSIQVCPEYSRSFTAQVVYTNCDGNTTTVTDDVYVAVSDLTITIDSMRSPDCLGGSNGMVCASYMSTGSAVLSYGWNPGGQGQTCLNNIPAGTYIFSVTDATNCSIFDTVDLNSPPPLVVNVPDSIAYSCNPNIFSGSMTAYVSGGDTTGGDYSYSWNTTPVQNTQTAFGLTAIGSYTVVVTDMSGCTGTDSGILDTVITPPVFNPPVITDVSCTGGTDGSIVVSLSQSTEPISYIWAPTLVDNDTVTGLAPGQYSVSATDANGCTASAGPYTVGQPTPVILVSPTITPVTCVAGGIITANPSGGTPGYTYIWSNGDTGNTADSVSAGPIDVTVTDANLCSASASYTMTTIAGVVAFDTVSITHVSCNEGNNGSITASATGGTGTITFNWGFQQGPSITGLTAGQYSVTITDTAGCSASTTYMVNEPTPIVFSTPVIDSTTCTTGGSISLTVSGGVPPYHYQWSNNDTTGGTIDSLAAGPYTLVVTDANSCQTSATYSVPAGAGAVSFGPATIVNNVCNGYSAGSISTTASGGTGIILFFWNPGNQTTSTISNLPAGCYNVTITDSVGCSASNTYCVTQPAPIVPNLTFSDLICFGDSSGTACATPTGGATPYTYRWSNPQQSTTQCISGLERGIIIVTVTDAGNCSVSASGIISQTEQLSYVRVLNLYLCLNPPYGDLEITVRGGIGPVIIDIPSVGSDTATRIGADSTGIFPGVPPGTYNFTLTDSLGCTTTGNFFVPPSAGSDNFDVETDSTSCYGSQFSDGSITVTPLSTNPPYTYSVDNGASFQALDSFTNLAAGNYTIITRNGYGCLDTVTAVVGEPLQVFANANPDTIITAPGVGNGISVTTQNFNNPVYTWTPTEGLNCTDCFDPTATVTEATVFYVTVAESDAGNCAVTDSVVIIVTAGFRMPNAFSPNGDGRNDTYGPFHVAPITINDFKIYNRWGELVHGDVNFWDGAFKGKEQPAGTYVYYIEVERPDTDNPGGVKTERQQGSFTLLR